MVLCPLEKGNDMKKKIFSLNTLCWILIALTLLTACGNPTHPTTASTDPVTQAVTNSAETATGQVATEQVTADRSDTTAPQSDTTTPPTGIDNSPESVAAYLKEHGKLPDYFVTKKEAEAAGWVPSKGNLWEVLPGHVIGGDRFGNREGKLPKGKYRECDVNYSGGRRGAERIVFSEDGAIYYTKDHYNTFERLD